MNHMEQSRIFMNQMVGEFPCADFYSLCKNYPNTLYCVGVCTGNMIEVRVFGFLSYELAIFFFFCEITCCWLSFQEHPR